MKCQVSHETTSVLPARIFFCFFPLVFRLLLLSYEFNEDTILCVHAHRHMRTINSFLLCYKVRGKPLIKKRRNLNVKQDIYLEP